MLEVPSLQGDIVFDAKPDAVPYNYRVSYKVSQICLIMSMCGWKSSCSLIKLHMISFALCAKDAGNELLRFVNDELFSTPIVRFDPAVNKALTYAVAYGFIRQQQNGNYNLTDRGHKFTEQIKLVDDLMQFEKQYLTTLAKKLTETKITSLENMWRANNVED